MTNTESFCTTVSHVNNKLICMLQVAVHEQCKLVLYSFTWANMLVIMSLLYLRFFHNMTRAHVYWTCLFMNAVIVLGTLSEQGWLQLLQTMYFIGIDSRYRLEAFWKVDSWLLLFFPKEGNSESIAKHVVVIDSISILYIIKLNSALPIFPSNSST